ncbi:MAG: hypothetical protein COV29_02205 [Candidatus Yanofskybacteria bacterium CG10_big_fil_rev_8_21_14_0_10_36_16]|uniref:Glycosyltransferase RgtA/B/C/D-like domain-containing protein n=1 Tax=Candidatus Yanofskybacteria bacterium CG10_big_fil_rev_8_21_14_0_10_36_16 TaxID=1975096 RepID=A0A2J0Q7Q1_9BACT|nr:MAG: hypothetical protein COV29_02205 [Candidatus Yanofskybacteria bacterium CG10_big_fil_rev_8_21_14_0_10_36_16]
MNRKKEIIILAIILAIFILIRVWGLDFSYFQDERKYAGVGPFGSGEMIDTPHPPIGEFLWSLTATVFGNDNFRFTPFIFSIANLFLLYYLVKRWFGIKAALWSSLFFSISFYSVLASHTVDLDGAVLPFSFLLSLVYYFKFREVDSYKWGIALLVSLALGFFTKLSFIILIGAIITDFIFEKRHLFSKKLIRGTTFLVLGILAVGGFLFFRAESILQDGGVLKAINYARDFSNISGRSYLQILIQVSKAIFYASPLLIAIPFFITRKRLAEIRIFIIFFILSFLFYVVLFDFSRAALDKYLALIVVPLSVISGVAISDFLKGAGGIRQVLKNKLSVFWALYAGAVLLFINFLPHVAPPQYPKEEWFGRILSFDWNFLFPFTGGSGPLGFYVSWLFIGVVWILTATLVVLYFAKRKLRQGVLIAVLVVGALYNFIFVEEYLFGKFNGDSYALLNNAVRYIEDNDEIKSIITYRDIGGTELTNIGKYEKRIYAIPKNEKVHADLLNSFHGHYLVINIPKIEEDSMYTKYFDSCKIIYQKYSGHIPAIIYDCKKSEEAMVE